MRIQIRFPKIIFASLLITLALFLSFTTQAQHKKHPQDSTVKANNDYFKENYMRAEDFIYKPNIKTVLLYREGFVLTAPIIKAYSSEKLVFSFDDLDGGTKRIKYTFIHCDAYWTVSDLMQNEYLEGFYEDDVADYKLSFNTLQKYTHYSLTFPTDRMKPILSGNYLLKVYMEDNPDDILITRRFMIVDNKVNITAVCDRPTIVEYRNYKQQIDFSIDKTSYVIGNPYKDLKVIIQQNGRWDNAISNLQPLYVNGDKLDYNFEEGNVFSGGNIFREFDIKGMNFYTEFINKITRDADGYSVYLKPEERKTFKVYSYRKGIYGQMFIKSDANITDSDIEAEYVHVHFFLKYDAPLADGALYVCGALTDWRFTEDAKMKYNYDLKGYEANLYLKQGFYNYQYIFLENTKKVGDETLIEGTHFEADNQYTIYVYNREAGKIYDVLVGLKQFNTFSK